MKVRQINCVSLSYETFHLFSKTVNKQLIASSAIFSVDDHLSNNGETESENHTTAPRIYAVQGAAVLPATSPVNVLSLSQQERFREKQEDFRRSFAVFARGLTILSEVQRGPASFP